MHIHFTLVTMPMYVQAVLVDCGLVLDINPISIKALYGRALAHSNLQHHQVRYASSPPLEPPPQHLNPAFLCSKLTTRDINACSRMSTGRPVVRHERTRFISGPIPQPEINQSADAR